MTESGGELTGRVAVITGGGGAIGSAIATALAGAGARIVVADLDLAAAERTAATCDAARPPAPTSRIGRAVER